MSKDDLSMAYRINKKPRGVGPEQFYRTLIESVRDGRALPVGWSVTWRWRNSAKQAMREGPIIRESRKSRASFVGLMIRRLRRDAERFVPNFRAPEMRAATAEELEDLEDDEDISYERRRRKNPGEGTRKRRSRSKRSRAARKGWVTRRAKKNM